MCYSQQAGLANDKGRIPITMCGIANILFSSCQSNPILHLYLIHHLLTVFLLDSWQT